MLPNLEYSPSLHMSRWSTERKLRFRWAFCYLILYHAGSVLHWLPGMSFLLSWPEKIWHFLMFRLVIVLFHPQHMVDYAQTTGSGDKLIDYVGNAVCVIAAGVLVAVWSALDRRNENHEFLEAWLRVFARYSLALTLLSYGMAKVVPTQFQHLDAVRLNETYGASSPMGLLWSFMGYSTGYTIFAGLMEVLPGVLLFSRRTAPLGSLISFAVLTNIVALNFFYDVPVKLYSVNLLLLSGYLVWPHARPLWQLLIQQRPARPSLEVNIRLDNTRALKIANVAKAIFLTCVLLQCGVGGAERYMSFRLKPEQPHSELTDRGFHWSQEAPFNH